MQEKKQGASKSEGVSLEEMTPRQIVEHLDRYIVGQHKAKRALSIALRDRVRRSRLSGEMVGEVQPRNVILIGPTGVGKTELARRLARMSRSPFIKVEASKFTEVGYVGRDVESIIRDLAEIAVEMVREEKTSEIVGQAEQNAENRLLEILRKKRRKSKGTSRAASGQKEAEAAEEKLRKQLREGKLNSRVVELEVQERFLPPPEYLPSYLEEEIELQLKDLLAGVVGPRSYKKKMKVEEAIEYLVSEEESKLVDMEQVTREALDRVEGSGIVFIDELDKIAGRESHLGPDVSREGVQRDILPIVEGTSVSTRFGMLQTDQILFVAAGAFHVTRPADLIPELQGRFPIRVEMEPLTVEDLAKILVCPDNALTKQYQALLDTEGIKLDFREEAVDRLAHLAWRVNETAENIGARRLHTLMEALLEDISFEGPETAPGKVVIDAEYVERKLTGIVKDADLSRYIL